MTSASDADISRLLLRVAHDKHIIIPLIIREDGFSELSAEVTASVETPSGDNGMRAGVLMAEVAHHLRRALLSDAAGQTSATRALERSALAKHRRHHM
jgi:hypothetical protein